MKIVFQNPDLSIGIITPSEEILLVCTIEDVAEKDVPENCPYWIVADDVISADRLFRDAWELDGSALDDPDGIGGAGDEFSQEIVDAYKNMAGSAND
tara:strand:- start:140 stop:430 length:291 start_codon:yes stop_codon:yes gene_type:complete